MNTITHQETQALHAAVFTPAAATIAAYDLLLIPLSQLRPSSRNVRKSGGASIPELASSIARVGLLQNLTVTASSDGEHYESRQAIQAQQLQITQDRAAALEQARQVAVQERAREVRRRFQGDGTLYTPTTINYYNP